MKNDYTQEINSWHNQRIENLKSEKGWLTVSGLFWLKQGENTAGASKQNALHFPKGKAEEQIGTFILTDSTVFFQAKAGVTIKKNDSLFSSGIIFSPKIAEQSIVLEHRQLRWYCIKRGPKIGIRLRDLESDARKNFTTIQRFPLDEKWKITATYEAPKANQTIAVQDVIGLTTQAKFGGTLTFKVNDISYKLDATLEGADLFIVFADKTSGNTTYGGGRFLYAKVPLQGNTVILDFNKAYNPPCSFTDFATCPLPPEQNKLNLKITAGEMVYERH